jgi:hypothetical protein
LEGDCVGLSKANTSAGLVRARLFFWRIVIPGRALRQPCANPESRDVTHFGIPGSPGLCLAPRNDMPLERGRRVALNNKQLSVSGTVNKPRCHRENMMVTPYTIDISDERLAAIRAKVEA